MPITLNGDTGIQTPMYNGSITANAVTPSVNMKNRIINGAMVIAQRGTSATYSGTGQNTSSYNTIDRYAFATFGGNFPSGVYATVAQVTDAPTEYSNSLRVTANQTLTIGSSNARGIWVSQQIEGFNFRDCWNQQITLSFWVKSSNIGTYSLAFQTEGGGYATSYAINVANTWEYKTITLTHSTVLGTPNSTNGSGLGVVFGLGGDSTWIGTATANQWVAGNIPYLHGCKNLFDTANATWQITGVQLEKGSTATSFDYRPYGTELFLCQRYFWRDTGITVQAIAQANTYDGVVQLFFPVPMRATPTATTLTGGSAFARNISGSPTAGANTGTISNTWSTHVEYLMQASGGSGSVGTGIVVYSGGTGTASAEL